MKTPASFRAVATDLDGTLLRSDGTVSARTRAALAMAEEGGALLILVTGRPPRWMAEVVEQTGHRGVAILANGALVYDLGREEVIDSRLVEPAAASRLVRRLRDRLPAVAFAVERLDGRFAHEPAYRPRWPPADAMVAPITELVELGGVVKLLARSPGTGADALLDIAQDVATEAELSLTHSSTSTTEGLLEVAAAGVTKASALAGVVAGHGLRPRDVLAFGDMPNDAPMLRWAGWGVAMAHAHPLARAAADEITTGNDDEGVACVVERFFPARA